MTRREYRAYQIELIPKAFRDFLDACDHAMDSGLVRTGSFGSAEWSDIDFLLGKHKGWLWHKLNQRRPRLVRDPESEVEELRSYAARLRNPSAHDRLRLAAFRAKTEQIPSDSGPVQAAAET